MRPDQTGPVAPDPFAVVIFDLGGVLADFGGVSAMRELARIDSDDEVWRRWLTCRWVRTFEGGGCSAADFAEGVVSDWGLPISGAEFLDRFRGWLAGPFPGADELVRAVREVCPVGCLSNTNPVHWDGALLRWPRFFEMFDYRFLSFELGRVKPDVEIFERVAELTGLPLDRVLFLDDNLVNVEGASSAGMRAEHVRGIDEARAALVRAGVLPR